jgi:GNAT superfamily N-acetyltransferase
MPSARDASSASNIAAAPAGSGSVMPPTLRHHGRVTDDLTIRHGGAADVPAVLSMMDGAVDWLVARGRPGQWGTEPQSTNPRRQRQARDWASGGGLYLGELSGQPAGTLVVGEAQSYVPPAAEPELYVRLLVTDRRYAGRSVGARLLDHARGLARDRGVGLLRVDCYAGDDRALVGYYESQGFTATVPFSVPRPAGDWPGQVLEQRLR